MDDDFFLVAPYGTPFNQNQDEHGNVICDPIYVMCSVCGSAVVNKDYARDAHKRFHWLIGKMKTTELADAVEGDRVHRD